MIKKHSDILIFLLVGLIAINCKSIPSQRPAAKDSSVLGVKVKFNGLISDSAAARVYLVKLDTPANAKETIDGKASSLISKGEVMVSNWDENTDFDSADEVQKYYGEKMQPGMLSAGTLLKLFTTNKLASLKEFNNSNATKEEFLKESREDFNETSWTHLFQ